MKTFIALTIANMAWTGYALGQNVGNVFPVPAWEWVTVEKSIGRLSAESDCGIDRGGMVRVLGLSDNRQKALVRYTGGMGRYGTECPEGAIFWLPSERLAGFIDATKKADEERKHNAEEVGRILGD